MSGNPPVSYKQQPEENDPQVLNPESGGVAEGQKLPFDPMRVLIVTQRYWYIPVIVGLVFGVIAYVMARGYLSAEYTDRLMLIPNEVPTNLRANEFGESYKPLELEADTFLSLIHSRRVLAGVVRRQPGDSDVTVEDLRNRLQLEHDKKTGIIQAEYRTAGGREEVMSILEAYGREVEQLSMLLQVEEAQDVVRFLDRQLIKAESELSAHKVQMRDFLSHHRYLDGTLEMEADLRTRNEATMRLQTASAELSTVDQTIASLLDILRDHHPYFTQLEAARGQLSQLRMSYTDENPLVVNQLEIVRGIEKKIQDELAPDSPTGTSPEFTRDGFTNTVFLDLIKAQSGKSRLQAEVSTLREFLASVEERMSRMPQLNQTYARLNKEDERLQTVVDLIKARKHEAEMYIDEVIPAYKAFEGAVYESVEEVAPDNMLLAIAFLGIGFGSSAAFLILVFFELMNDRVVTTGDVSRLTGLEVLGGLTECPQNRGGSRVGPQDGGRDALDSPEVTRWSLALWKKMERRLDAQTGSSSNIIISSLDRGDGKTTWIGLLGRAAQANGMRVMAFVDRVPACGEWTTIRVERFLEHPQLAIQELSSESKAPRPVAVLLPDGWLWTRRHQAQLKRAIAEVEAHGRIVSFIEVVDPLEDENMLFLSSAANVFWMARSSISRNSDLAELIKVLRNMNTHLKGAMINRLPRTWTQMPTLGRSMASVVAALLMSLPTFASGADTREQPLPPYRLGPGDVVDIAVYANPDTIRQGIVVSPDGKINYLQARDIQAAGKTVNELREELTQVLTRYYRPGRAVVIPQTFRSKKYTVMGAVRDPGTYTLDRPVTVLEAVARARGLKVGLFDHKNVELADLSKAFLSRNGQKLPINFQELFRGQAPEMNLQLQHGDYLFFPSTSLNEVYLMGAVAAPGNVAMTEQLSLTQLVSRQGGFLEDAYLSKVAVIRGSLDDPEVHIVNVRDVLKGESSDFLLEIGDYIYVSDKPWRDIELVLDAATRAFIGAASSTLASEQVPAIIR